MQKAFIISTILLFISGVLYAQENKPSKIFCLHKQTCHVTSFTEEDYILTVYDNSNVEISLNNTFYSWLEKSNEIVCKGRYELINDTLKITYFDNLSTIDYKTEKTTEDVKNVNKTYKWLPSLFVIKGDELKSIDKVFPTLLSSSHDGVIFYEKHLPKKTIIKTPAYKYFTIR